MASGLSVVEFESTAVVRSRREEAAVLSTLGQCAFTVVTALAGAGPVIFAEWTALLVAIPVLVSATALARSYILVVRPRACGAKVRVGASGIELETSGRSTRFSTGEIASAVIIRRVRDGEHASVVQFCLRPRMRRLTHGHAFGDTLSVYTPDDTTARNCMDALGLAARRPCVRLELARPARRLVHLPIGLVGLVTAVATIALVAHAAPVDPEMAFVFGVSAIGLVTLLIYQLLRTVARPSTVTVGDDGIMIVEGLRRRFVSLADIEGIETTGNVALVRVRNQHSIPLGRVDRDVVNALHDRLAEALEKAEPRSSRFGSYARRGQSAEEWQQTLKRTVLAEDYRHGGSPLEEARRVLGTPHATKDERVGAALALRVAGAAPDELRVASERIADERLRVVVAEIAEADEEPELERVVRKTR